MHELFGATIVTGRCARRVVGHREAGKGHDDEDAAQHGVFVLGVAVEGWF